MEANSVSVENPGAYQIQLRRIRQRSISYSSSTEGMQAIPERKWTAFPSPNRLHEPNKVYNHKRTDPTTNMMEPSPERLRLQN